MGEIEATIQKKNIFVTFLSNRIFWGFLAGFVCWLVLSFPLRMPLGYSPAISVIASMLISKLYEPKRLAGLSAGLGLIAGVVYGLQTVFQEFPIIDVGIVLITPILVGITSIFSGLLFACTGLVFGTIAKLYRQGAIF
jgi:hypothetical protein